MGSVQSYLPVAAVAAGAAAYGYVQLNKPAAAPQHAGPSSSSAASAYTSAASSKKQKQKKKAGTGAGAGTSEKGKDAHPAEPIVVPFPPVVPGSFDTQSPTTPSEPQPKPKNKKKKAKKTGGGGGDAQSESSATAPESSAAAVRMTKPKKGGAANKPAALDNDGWMKVETKKKPAKPGAAAEAAEGSGSQGQGLEVSTSDLATSVTTGNSSPVTERTEDEGHLADSVSSENRRTLAEKLLPKPRKTGVEDLLEEPDYPEVSRVMRIKPQPDEQPAAGFSWADYEDVDSRGNADDADGEDDDGWGVVKSRGRQRANNAPSATSAPTVQKSTETLTKKQRQHAAKREAQKAAKADAEQDRLATLAKHKRELERARMDEQTKATKKTASGGMSAYVDENGKLVWQ
ncbi:hypothetical protein GSI_13124 [Ganoderma sinense ZZ0214-1]|uniref:Uncharacterized protein n=1 Tax=Ganoderma sinense ZZ0214-1 TaxID=1077348 RepID=A0A2G8RUP3_9APHY|nr:hypothetical protein GSI_13124 [Ganoderma sinense ZZ0214-1]